MWSKTSYPISEKRETDISIEKLKARQIAIPKLYRHVYLIVYRCSLGSSGPGTKNGIRPAHE
jgi:hypothetical protein